MLIRETVVVGFDDSKLCDDDQIEQIVRELMDVALLATHKRLLLNFKGVTSISSAMVTKLVMLNKVCKAHSVRLQMCNLAPAVFEIFRVTKLNKLFQIVQHIDDDPDGPEPAGCRLFVPDRSATRFITMKRVQATYIAWENEA